MWPLLVKAMWGAASLGEVAGGGSGSRVPQVTAEPRGSPDSVSTWGQRGVRGLCNCLFYLPACSCLSETINSSRLYFQISLGNQSLSHGMNLFHLEFFNRKLLWRKVIRMLIWQVGNLKSGSEFPSPGSQEAGLDRTFPNLSLLGFSCSAVP